MKNSPSLNALKAYYNELHNEEVEKAVEATRKSDLTKYLDQSRKRAIKNNIRKGDVALDLGGGGGDNYKLLEPYFNKVILTDLSIKPIKLARNSYPSLEIVQAEGYSQPFPDNLYDYLLLSEVIEHVQPFLSVDLLMEISRLLRPNGLALVTTPNGMEYRRILLWWPIILLSKLTTLPEMGVAAKLYQTYCKISGYKTGKMKLFKKYRFLEHINILTPKKLIDQAEAVGLTVESLTFSGIRPIFAYPFKHNRRRIEMLKRVEERCNKAWAMILCSGMYVLLRKTP